MEREREVQYYTRMDSVPVMSDRHSPLHQSRCWSCWIGRACWSPHTTGCACSLATAEVHRNLQQTTSCQVEADTGRDQHAL
eukprot:1875347-Amphidinium_carterae.1